RRTPPAGRSAGARPGVRGSWRGHAAVDVQRLPQDVARLGGGEEDVGGGELGGLSRPPERGALAELGQGLLRLAVGYLQRGPDRTGSDRVDADAARSELLGHPLREVVDGRLGGGVV